MTGPRPLQSILGAMQFGEQLRLSRAAEDRANRNATANMLQQFMTMAPSSTPSDRGALAEMIGKAAGIDPAQLMASVASRPVSAATTGDKAAAASFDATSSMYPRIQEAVGQIPDSTVRDIAMNAVSQQFAGQPAGQTRVQGTMADPTKTPQEDVNAGVLRQLGSMLSVPEAAQLTQAQERIQQGWTQIADQKVATAVNQSLARAELSFRMKMAEAEARGENTKGLKAQNPATLMTELFDMTKELTGKPQTQEARGMFTWMIRGKYEQMIGALGGRENIDPEVLKTLDQTFSPENIVNSSPTFWTGFFGKNSGGKK